MSRQRLFHSAFTVLLLALVACGPAEPDPTSPDKAPAPPEMPGPSTSVPKNPPPTAIGSAYPPAPRHDLLAHDLDRFLQVRRKMFDVYRRKGTAMVLNRWTRDQHRIDQEAAGDAELLAVLDRFNSARHLGLAEAGMHEVDYARIEELVYGRWWKATAGVQDIDKAIEFQQELLGLLDESLQDLAASDPGRRDLEVRRISSERRIAALEWTRTPEAARTLSELPEDTRKLCESRADELRKLEMSPLQPYARLLRVTGVQSISAAQR